MSVSVVSCPQMSETAHEIATQPEVWRWAAEAAEKAASVLPQPGERVAVVGCGTSWFIAQTYAALREATGEGETDAFTASEFPVTRRYDRIVVISRSGTTTEVLRLVRSLPTDTTVAIGAVAEAPISMASRHAVTLDFADEASVVQTRFATSVLALLRAHLGEDLSPMISDAERALAEPLPMDPESFDHFVFLGHGWTVGLASEAALKMREAAQAHTEAYPAMEYRHGPISLAGTGSLVWILTTPDPSISVDVRATGARVIEAHLDPMAELVLIQRTAVGLAESRGLDPDRPRHLTRSIVLS